ncbi:MAG: type II toxin-antitoxin system MqsA family antitoxin [Segetibacter sp.]
MECIICKNGTTVKGKTTYSLQKEGSLLVYKNVEAEVCNNCGEAYLSVETTRKLQQLAADAAKKGAEVEIINYKVLP